MSEQTKADQEITTVNYTQTSVDRKTYTTTEGRDLRHQGRDTEVDSSGVKGTEDRVEVR